MCVCSLYCECECVCVLLMLFCCHKSVVLLTHTTVLVCLGTLLVQLSILAAPSAVSGTISD